MRQEELSQPESLSDGDIRLEEEQKWFVVFLVGAISLTLMTLIVGVLACHCCQCKRRRLRKKAVQNVEYYS